MKIFKYNYQIAGLKDKQEDYLYTTSSDKYKYQLGVVVDGVSNSVNPRNNVVSYFISSIEGHFRTRDTNSVLTDYSNSNSLKNYYKLNHNYTNSFPKIINVPNYWPRTLKSDYETHLYSVFKTFLMSVKTYIREIVSFDDSIKTTKQQDEYVAHTWKNILTWINDEFDFLRVVEIDGIIVLSWKVHSLNFDTYFEIIKKLLTIKKIQNWWNSKKNGVRLWDYPFYYTYGDGDRLESKIIYESMIDNKIEDNTHISISTLHKLTPESFETNLKDLVLSKPFGSEKFVTSDRSSLTFGLSMIKYGYIWFAGVGDVQIYTSNISNPVLKNNLKLNKIMIDDSVNQKEYGNSTIAYDEFYTKNRKFSSGITASYSNTDENFKHIKTQVQKLADVDSVLIMSDGCLSKDINRWTLDKIINTIKIKNTGTHPFLQIAAKLNKLKNKHSKYIKNNFKNLLNTDINTLIFFDEKYNYSIDFKMIKEYVAVDKFVKENIDPWTSNDILWIKMMYISYMIYVNRNDNATFHFIKLDKNSSLYNS